MNVTVIIFLLSYVILSMEIPNCFHLVTLNSTGSQFQSFLYSQIADICSVYIVIGSFFLSSPLFFYCFFEFSMLGKY